MKRILDADYVGNIIGQRKRECNKGDNGKGLLVAGSLGLTGAALMAAAAALRAGIGTLRVLCPEAVRPALYVLPEAMVTSFNGESWSECDAELINGMINNCTCIGIGPGIGRDNGVVRLLRMIVESDKPVVIDADGLNMLAQTSGIALHKNVILTPHPGEMSRLTGKNIEQIVEHPAEVAMEYAALKGCTVLLKGATSVIAAPDGNIMHNVSGNPGLAKGGSGDVLTGIVLALLGQKLNSFDAACAGAFLLGCSANTALRLLGERMLMARDVVDAVQATVSCLDII
ncbi:MAG: NAD(P)H-hydrate dehydratase [Clostridia bacterium]